MRNIINILAILLFIVVLSCDKDDYKVGGDLHDPKVNMTTYDYLKSNRFGMFDTLLLLVDAAGIKDKINQQGTFFAPTDYSINLYLNRRSLALQRVDPSKNWTVDSLLKYELPRFADSLDIYFVQNELLPNDKLLATGTVFKNAKNTDVVASYETTTSGNLGANFNSSVLPKIVYFTYLYQELPAGFDIGRVSWPLGIRTRVQTSNVQTTTGTLHVLNNGHVLFFYR